MDKSVSCHRERANLLRGVAPPYTRLPAPFERHVINDIFPTYLCPLPNILRIGPQLVEQSREKHLRLTSMTFTH